MFRLYASTRYAPGAALPLLLGALLWNAGCGNGDAVDTLFPDDISLVELEQALEQPQRVRVGFDEDFTAANPVVERVLVKDREELTDREHIEAEVSDFSFQGGQGTVTVLGGIQVAFDETTELRSDDDFGEDDELSIQEFIQQLEERFAENRPVSIEADRTAPAEPSPPDAMSFFAEELEIDDEERDGRFAVNMDRDNLILGPEGGDATIRAFGMDFAVDRGVTDLQAVDLPDRMNTVNFEGEVVNVDPQAGLVFLEDGRVIRVAPDTDMGDPELRSLQAVQDALERGERVVVDGQGLREDGSGEIVAMELDFQSGFDEDGDGIFDEPNGF